MPVFVVAYQDPFRPVLTSSESLKVSEEQKAYIREVLEVCSSDTAFAQKAYDSIHLILTAGSTKIPTITQLTPNSAELGDPSFTLHVHGTNFTSGSKIIFAGVEEPTTFVSATEITTGVDMSVWLGPDVLPVHVQNADGVMSTPMMFTFTDGTVMPAKKAATPAAKTVVKS